MEFKPHLNFLPPAFSKIRFLTINLKTTSEIIRESSVTIKSTGMHPDQLCRPMSQEYRHGITSVSLINYHFVWIPRRSRKVLVGAIAERLKESIYEVASYLECKVLALEIMPDRVYLFLNCPPNPCTFRFDVSVQGTFSS
jgi:hypothetical protein